MMFKLKWICSAAACLLAGLAAEAAVEVAPIFSNNAVLQRDMQVPVWGKADPGEKVTVTFAGQTVSTEAGADGKWMVKLAPMAASAENRTMEIAGKANSIKVENVLVGEVWICSGQSNMEMPLWGGSERFRSKDGDKVAAESNFPLIRFVKMPREWSATPRADWEVTWSPVAPDNIAGFSAVGYYFGRQLFTELQIPIGLLGAYWGGTRIEPWTPPEGFDARPSLTSIKRNVDAKIPGTATYKELTAKTSQDYKAWLAAFDAATAAGKELPMPPTFPGELRPFNRHQDPTVLYNRMMFPFVPYAVRGAIWYQGEANLSDAALYTDKMFALHEGWKKVFGNPQLKFYFAQLAPYNYGGDPERLPLIWEAQQAFADASDLTAMAVINDVGNLKDIHPNDKETVGKRLAAYALKRDYGKKEIKADGPKLKSAKVENGQFVLEFDFVESWTTRDGQAIANFEIAGEDGVFQPAKAIADGAKLLVGSSQVSAPKQLRYMWKQTAEGNLFSDAGIPLGAFRTSLAAEFPEVTAQVPEAAGYKPVYRYNLLSGSGFGDKTRVRYEIDYSNTVKNGAIKRVGYFLKLVDQQDAVSWVWVSMEAFTQTASKLGVPVKSTNATFQSRVRDLQIASNVPGLKTGKFAEGNIEFWPNNYGQRNTANVPGASGSDYDWGDVITKPQVGYGSMQVHNFLEKQTVFAYNKFAAGTNCDLGIGNAPAKNTDWTFQGTGKNYKSATLYVMVQE